MMVRQRTPTTIGGGGGGGGRKGRLIKAKYGEGGGGGGKGKGGEIGGEEQQPQNQVQEEWKDKNRHRRTGFRDCCVMLLAFLAPVTILEFYRADDSTIGLWNKFLDILKIPEHNNKKGAAAAADVSSSSSSSSATAVDVGVGTLAKLVSKTGLLTSDADSTSSEIKTATTSTSDKANAAPASASAAAAAPQLSKNVELTAFAPNPEKNHIPREQTVAYVVPFFKSCGRQTTMRDAATVLRQSVHLQSGQAAGKYGYQMYALVLRETCPREVMDVFESLGYKVFEVDPPVQLDQIQNDYVKQNLGKGNGDGGVGSYIQLLAHQLVEEPIFAILYINTMLLQPLDDLFTAIQYDATTAEGQQARTNLLPKLERSTTTLPNQIHHFFVRDYPNTAYGRKPVTHTPGFYVARKNPAIVQQAVDLIHRGNYTEGMGTASGWGGTGYTMYFSTGLTMPGFYAYFLDTFFGDTSVELDGCLFNHNGMDNKFRKPPRFNAGDGKNVGKCRSGETTCSDCITTSVDKISTLLYDVTCFEPWKCYGEGGEGGTQRKKINTECTTIEHCLTIQREWHNLRTRIEMTMASAITSVDAAPGRKGLFHSDVFSGHCIAHNDYIPMAFTRSVDSQIADVLWGGK